MTVDLKRPGNRTLASTLTPLIILALASVRPAFADLWYEHYDEVERVSWFSETARSRLGGCPNDPAGVRFKTDGIWGWRPPRYSAIVGHGGRL
jgi:hypothetical protein